MRATTASGPAAGACAGMDLRWRWSRQDHAASPRSPWLGGWCCSSSGWAVSQFSIGWPAGDRARADRELRTRRHRHDLPRPRRRAARQADRGSPRNLRACSARVGDLARWVGARASAAQPARGVRRDGVYAIAARCGFRYGRGPCAAPSCARPTWRPAPTARFARPRPDSQRKEDRWESTGILPSTTESSTRWGRGRSSRWRADPAPEPGRDDGHARARAGGRGARAARLPVRGRARLDVLLVPGGRARAASRIRAARLAAQGGRPVSRSPACTGGPAARPVSPGQASQHSLGLRRAAAQARRGRGAREHPLRATGTS